MVLIKASQFIEPFFNIEIVTLMAEKRLMVEPMITHRLPLDQVGQAADMLIDHPDRTLGVVLTMSH